MTRWERRNLLSGLAFAAPWILGFLIFTGYPLMMSIYYSFTDFNAVLPPVWIGLANYRELFLEDPLFWKSLYNTFFFAIFSVPLSLSVSLGLAILLNQPVPFRSIFRTVFFLPSIVPLVASSVLWL